MPFLRALALVVSTGLVVVGCGSAVGVNDGPTGTVAARLEAQCQKPQPVIAAYQPLKVDPTTLKLTGWYRANYVGVPLVGEQSVGPSTGRELNQVFEGRIPKPSTTPLNGFQPIKFDGVDDQLEALIGANPVNLDTYITPSSWWVGALVKVAVAPPAATQWYDDAPFIGEQHGGWGVSVTASGARACNYDGAFVTTPLTPEVAVQPNEWAWVEAWLSKGSLNVAVNGGVPAKVRAGNLTALFVRQLRLGTNYNSSIAFNGEIADLMIATSRPDEMTAKRIRTHYLKRRYRLSLGSDVEELAEPEPTSTAKIYQTTRLTETAAFEPRDGARLEYFKGKWWMLGGWQGTLPNDWSSTSFTTNQVWSSHDGSTWTLELAHDEDPPTSGPNARWKPRHTFMTWVYDDQLWVAGSDEYSAEFVTGAMPSDVWRSADGKAWERVAASSVWSTDSGFVQNGLWNAIPAVYDCQMHVIGGRAPAFDGQTYNDWPTGRRHWRSKDGLNWERLPDLPVDRAAIARGVELNGRLFLVGGSSGTYVARTSSSSTLVYDGTTWAVRSTDSRGRWQGRDWIAVASFDQKLWALTGYNPEIPLDMGGAFWSDDEGRTWERATAVTYFPSHADGVAVGAGSILVASGARQGRNTHQITALSP